MKKRRHIFCNSIENLGRCIVSAKNGKARVACVIGDPIAHSLSPYIHEYWLQKYDINGAYVPFRVTADAFSSTLDSLFSCGCVGMNITLPHKQQAYAYADHVDETAIRLGAVNTLVLRDGAVHGFNSDALGFARLWQESFAQSRATNPQRVVLLGAGGAAPAIIAALYDNGCREVIIANRTLERAHNVVALMQTSCPECHFSVCHLDDVVGIIPSVDALVNSIAIGMLDEHYFVPWFDNAPIHMCVVDVSYSALGTPLTRFAIERGFNAYDGLPMLVWQATVGFELWFGVQPEIDTALYGYLRT
ncbi:MAG: shikimate dehydrogenase [Alphaproteobacteria bacterium]|nr:MAG: shikimate dehydrogenase [Alphaproteobacteria bacterium]